MLSLILGFIIFFAVFFTIFTIIPRVIFVFLLRIISFDDSKNFLKNYFSILIAYLILGVPLTLILYQLSAFGDKDVIKSIFIDNVGAMSFLFVLIILTSIRLSLITKKRCHLNKNNFLKTHITSIVPIINEREREELHKEYFSFIFGILFTSFFFGILLIVFNILFLPDTTRLIVPAISVTITEICNNTGKFLYPFLKYGLIGILITLFGEICIRILGYHKVNI